MDQTDYEIMNLLSKDARMPFVKIAEKLSIGVDAVIRRFKKLREDGVVLSSTIVLDFQSCGFKGLCGLLIKINPELDFNSILDDLKKAPNSFLLGEMWGDYEFYIESYYRDFEEILDLIRYLQKINGITSIDLLLFTNKQWSIPSEYNFDTAYPAFPNIIINQKQ